MKALTTEEFSSRELSTFWSEEAITNKLKAAMMTTICSEVGMAVLP
jgi:hypothetical protein